MSFRRPTPDQITTYLGVAIALNTALAAQGAIDTQTAGLVGAILVAINGYYTNKRS